MPTVKSKKIKDTTSKKISRKLPIKIKKVESVIIKKTKKTNTVKLSKPSKTKKSTKITKNDSNSRKSLKNKVVKKAIVKSKKIKKDLSEIENKINNFLNIADLQLNYSDDFQNDNIEEGYISIDILENDENIIIISPVSGVGNSNLSIDIEIDKITIKGERVPSFNYNGFNMLYEECFWGKFSRTILLPCEIIKSKTLGKLDNGILKIILFKNI